MIRGHVKQHQRDAIRKAQTENVSRTKHLIPSSATLHGDEAGQN
jgi:hypothetical protein